MATISIHKYKYRGLVSIYICQHMRLILAHAVGGICDELYQPPPAQPNQAESGVWKDSDMRNFKASCNLFLGSHNRSGVNSVC